MTELHALVYVSRSNLDCSRDSFAASINAILITARANNAERGMTGALLFDEVFFAQMLEGPASAIETTFQRIRRDQRNSDVTLLSFDAVSERRFGEWNMAYAGASGVLLPAIRSGDILTSPTVCETGRAGRKIIDLLTSVIRHDMAREAMMPT